MPEYKAVAARRRRLRFDTPDEQLDDRWVPSTSTSATLTLGRQRTYRQKTAGIERKEAERVNDLLGNIRPGKP